MAIYLLFLTFFFGVSLGSFINVLIDRLPRGEGVLGGRSHCDHCHTPLLWYDLVPIFSFLWLRGRCRFCRTKIPSRLLIVELLSGLGWALTAYHFFDASFLATPLPRLILATYYLLLLSSGIVLFFTDLESGILPDAIILPTAVLVFLWRLCPIILNSIPRLILDTSYLLLPAFGLAAFFWLLILLTRGRGMGFGDVKLGFLIGLVLGWPLTLVAAFLAFLLGGLISVMLLLAGRKHFGETVPFGPFLILGTMLALLFGSQLWQWYLLRLG